VNRAGQILAELARRRTGYLPGDWRPPADGSGPALLSILAHYAALVEDGLGLAPDKAFLSFLDALGVTLLAPTPARAPLVFTLADDAPADVPLAADTQVAAVIAPALPATLGTADSPAGPAAPDEPVLFATDRSISLARATLACVSSVVPATDECADHTAALATGFTVFAGLGPIAHHLYLGHDTLFDLAGPVDIGLQVGVSQQRPPSPAAQGVELRWEYLAAAGWLAFEPVIDQTHGFTVDGEVLLRKICGPPLVRGVVNGVESFWIRARVSRALPLPGSAGDHPLPRLDRLRVRVSLTRPGLAPDAAFNDGLRLDPSKGFRPFGFEPTVGASFVVACDEAFKRPGARIRLSIEPATTVAGTGPGQPVLAWEYSTPGTGNGWTELLQSTIEFLRDGPARELQFGRPDDWQQATIGGERHFWLRIRVADGDYGRTTFGPGGVQTVFPKPPLLARLRLAYSYDTGLEELDHVLAVNRFSFADWTSAAKWGREAFPPFAPVSDRQPAVYLGFSAPPPVGLVGLFADGRSADDQPAPGAGGSPFTWEYRSAGGWSELAVLDETAGLRQRGAIHFIGQPDHVAAAGPDRDLYWMRARLKTSTPAPDPLPMGSLYLNAVWATNRAAVAREIVGRSDGAAGQTYALLRPSPLPGESIEVQEWSGAGREWESLFRDVAADDMRVDRDAQDRVTGVWVRWHEQPHLYRSGRGDRHYTLDRTGGMLRFGDGGSGRRPPPGAPIAASYRYGGGPQGNLPAGTISQLHSAVPYVRSITNPLPATGGAAAESTSVPLALRHPPAGAAPARPGGGVWARGPHHLRHRGRALSASDYEWLARDASAEVAQAHFYGARGPDGDDEPGWVTVVVAPWSGDPQPQPSPELLVRVQEYLQQRAPAAVARQIRVVGPSYQAVSVVTDVVVADPGLAAEVEERLRTALARFLHPLRGGRDGAGWTFGEPVRLSHVAAVIEGTPDVEFAEALGLSADSVAYGESVPIGPDLLPASGRHLVKLRLEG
jgi:hypothetical protein